MPPGVVGEITATGLHNLAMPLIRYRTGDTAAWSLKTCSCGQSFPIVERIEGRLSDGIYNAEGLLVSGMALRTMITPHLNDTNILYSQVIQSDRRVLEVRIVKGPGYRHPEDTEVIRGALRFFVGEMNIEFRFCGVEDLERSPIGKIRYCYNRLSPYNAGTSLHHA
ncbi:MAG: hypothetical protein ACREX4_14370 [Gammaproteobacteria bacterium]